MWKKPSPILAFREVNPSTPRPEGQGLPFDKLKAPSTTEGLRVDPERRSLTPPLKAGLGAAERVKSETRMPKYGWSLNPYH